MNPLRVVGMKFNGRDVLVKIDSSIICIKEGDRVSEEDHWGNRKSVVSCEICYDTGQVVTVDHTAKEIQVIIDNIC